MLILKTTVLVILAGLLATPATTMAAEQKAALWVMATLDGQFGSATDPSPWKYLLRAQGRGFDALEGTRQAVGHAAIGHTFSDSLTGWFGYAYYHTNSNQIGTFTEHRFWQALSWKTSAFSASTFKSRSLLEERWVEGRSGTSIRFRQQFRLDTPIKSNPGWQWIVGIEPFFNLNDVDWAETGWVQNRTFIGVSIPLSPTIKVETGYLNQWVNPRGLRDIMSHTLVANFRFK